MSRKRTDAARRRELRAREQAREQRHAERKESQEPVLCAGCGEATETVKAFGAYIPKDGGEPQVYPLCPKCAAEAGSARVSAGAEFHLGVLKPEPTPH
jgi:hypothetical protein